ncbi:lipoate--protein ligase family protein [Amphritea sp. 1_MG-2023]|uniref:lipoate--protein ligase family protein n=1 Tax=Amphritea sp. 1_MG-2023 TaxID=3062670 RepID=UPI0026E25215|nr:lipoate--protein ligase family protein [Amphritea sp. 1_MG-2023]MDO6563753.1 lipoate--protein ligase family protein [Amphritea sp. 1_MG-2023]
MNSLALKGRSQIAKIKLNTPVDINEGLALEQTLLDQVLSGQVSCGYALWRSQQALVVPRSATNRPNFQAASDYCAEQGWPVVIRSTGGELTPQSEGFINLTMAIKCQKGQMSIKESYQVICNGILGWLSTNGIQGGCSAIEGAFCDGDFNVVIDGQKIAGTAQRWKKITNPLGLEDSRDMALLMHAVILCEGDLPTMWGISNAFYEKCQLNPFIVANKHISLAQIMNQSGEQFVLRSLDGLDSYLNRYIEKYR